MPSPPDRLLSTDAELAAERLRRGGLVAVPTETVYGLAAAAGQPDAVARIYEVKGRPRDHPLIVHVAELEHLEGWIADFSPSARALAGSCWPGPLTMLLERGPRAGDEITGGRDIVGVRMPAHPLTQLVLRLLGGPVAAPSANRFGKVSPTTASHVMRDLGDRLDPDRDLVLDGGPCEVGVESTIVDLTSDPPQVLRAGAITEEQIERLLERRVADAAGPSRASGMLASHYAPDCRVVAAIDPVEAAAVAAIERSRGLVTRVLDRTDDLVTAAQALYADLRSADDDGVEVLIVVMPPPEGIGHAIRDRIVKAAAQNMSG